MEFGQVAGQRVAGSAPNVSSAMAQDKGVARGAGGIVLCALGGAAGHGAAGNVHCAVNSWA